MLGKNEIEQDVYLTILRGILGNVQSDSDELLQHLKATALEIESANERAIAIGRDNAVTREMLPRERPIVMLIICSLLAKKMIADLDGGGETEEIALGALCCESMLKQVAGGCLGIQLSSIQGQVQARTLKAKKAADVRHDKPGGNRDKRDAIRKAWASGKYSSRDVCAEQECAALNMSFSTARKALIGVPNPR